MIVLGVDTHKRSHTIAAIAAATGELLDARTVPVGRREFGACCGGRAASTASGCGHLRTADTSPGRWSAFSSSAANACCGSRRT
jgi:hypothetical protein